LHFKPEEQRDLDRKQDCIQADGGPVMEGRGASRVDGGACPRHSWIAFLLLGLFVVPPADAFPRLDIVDGELWDHASGLVWQSLEKTRGLPLPTDPTIGDWRVATGNEIIELLGAPQDERVARESDFFFALSFFAEGTPCPRNGYEGCFVGWWHDVSSDWPDDPTYYNLAGYLWTAMAGDPDHVLVHSEITLGSYTEENCGGTCSDYGSLYTVRAIPEPGTGVLLAAGLIALGRARPVRTLDGRHSLRSV
jgi:hypothetical protein